MRTHYFYQRTVHEPQVLDRLACRIHKALARPWRQINDSQWRIRRGLALVGGSCLVHWLAARWQQLLGASTRSRGMWSSDYCSCGWWRLMRSNTVCVWSAVMTLGDIKMLHVGSWVTTPPPLTLGRVEGGHCWRLKESVYVCCLLFLNTAAQLYCCCYISYLI